MALIDPQAIYFATFDARHGYWQVFLHPDSRHLTTIITEYGLYRFIRAPVGLTSSGDVFCQRTDEALAGLPQLQKLVDDIMITGRTKKELLERIEMMFKRCLEKQITLSKPKDQIGKEVKFAVRSENMFKFRDGKEHKMVFDSKLHSEKKRAVEILNLNSNLALSDFPDHNMGISIECKE